MVTSLEAACGGKSMFYKVYGLFGDSVVVTKTQARGLAFY